MDIYTVPVDILIRNFSILADSGASSRSLLVQSKRHVSVLVGRTINGQFFSIDELEGFDDAPLTLKPGNPLKLTITFNSPTIDIDHVQGR